MKLTSNNVAIKVEEKSRTTKSGLIITETSQDPTSRGTVVAVGPGLVMNNGVVVAMTVAVGDTVHCPTQLGHPIVVNGEKVLLIKESDIMLIEDVE